MIVFQDQAFLDARIDREIKKLLEGKLVLTKEETRQVVEAMGGTIWILDDELEHRILEVING